jgi:hypothetical protein
MTKNSLLVPSIIGLGLFSLILSIYIALNSENQTPGQTPIARAERNSGQVLIFRKNMTKKSILDKKSDLFALDTIETGPDGGALLEFDSLYQVQLEENTSVTLNTEKERTQIIIKRGDIHFESYGREGSVFISRDGETWSASDYEQNYRKQGQNKLAQDQLTTESQTQIATPYSNPSGLTSVLIQETLKLQKTAFFKCYTFLLQRTPGVVGNASLSFTIEKSGKVYNAELASSSITDTTFKKCLIDAIRRVQFKSFNGDAISTIFPLKFE